MIQPAITNGLRFVSDDEPVECRGRVTSGPAEPCTMADGQPAYAIHLWWGFPVCSYHSPADNIFVPCTVCGERPAYSPESVEEDPMCQICIKALVDRAASKAFPAPREPETVGEQCRQMSGAPEWDVTQPEYAPFGSQGNPPTGGVDWNEQDLHPKPLRKRRPLGQGCDHV